MKGMTLIELMIALFLSFLVLTGLFTIYLGMQKNQDVQAALSVIQDNARMAENIFTTQVHAAGYVGCARLTNDFPFKNSLITPQNRISGDNNSMTVRHASFDHASVIKTMSNYSVIKTSKNTIFSEGDFALISDCQSAELFFVKNSSVENDMQIIHAAKALTKKYPATAEVFHFEMNTYFVDQTDRKTPSGKPIYALYMRDIQQYKTELIEGVDNIQITYSEIQDGHLIEHSTDQVRDWANVRGVSLQLSLSSPYQFPLHKKEYLYVALREV